MADPDWYTKAKAEGRITEQGVNASAFGPVLDRALMILSPEKYELAKAFITVCRSEAQFQDSVYQLASHLGWKVVHVRKVLVKMGGKMHYETPWDLDGAGSFDLDFYRERHFKAELKFGRNKPTPEQRTWGLRYDAAGVENYIWYPKDCEQIIEVLTCHRPKTG